MIFQEMAHSERLLEGLPCSGLGGPTQGPSGHNARPEKQPAEPTLPNEMVYCAKLIC